MLKNFIYRKAFERDHKIDVRKRLILMSSSFDADRSNERERSSEMSKDILRFYSVVVLRAEARQVQV